MNQKITDVIVHNTIESVVAYKDLLIETMFDPIFTGGVDAWSEFVSNNTDKVVKYLNSDETTLILIIGDTSI